MKVGIYSPYLETLGGGERYMLTFAEYCDQRGFAVEVFWHDPEVLTVAQERFGLQLELAKVNTRMARRFASDVSYMDKIMRRVMLPSYDVLFFLSDGSIPNLYGKQNWLHFQVPFVRKEKQFWEQQKLSRIHRVLCNSQFTKRRIDASFGIESEVLYPPVGVHDFAEGEGEKEQIILSVGRFDQLLNAKRQDVLIQAFGKMIEKGLRDWKLVLVGGVQHGEEELVRLRELAMDYPVEFVVNASYEELVSWYQRATFYWHAAGFEIDEKKQPEKVEHFGMSVVEAMAAGCVPVVFPAGGIKEIVRDKKTGYFWHDVQGLVSMMLNMTTTIEKEKGVIEAAVKRARRFGKERFFGQLDGYFGGLL